MTLLESRISVRRSHEKEGQVLLLFMLLAKQAGISSKSSCTGLIGQRFAMRRC